jgi:error-prone DNA polymerase
MAAAGFSGAEADRLRRAMATFRRSGKIHAFRDKFIGGMVGNGYRLDFAERCFQQIQGFGEYGFPESHAASFALLVYVSAWLKCHYPAAFAAALLNSQPMGFYAPAQIVRDAREHGVEVRGVDLNASDWDVTLEPGQDAEKPALRLGLRQVKGIAQKDADALVSARGAGYRSPADLLVRSGLGRPVLTRLAEADGFRSLGLDRRRALWAVKGLRDEGLPLFAGLLPDQRADAEPAVWLPEMRLGEHIVSDYAFLELSLKGHPMALLRQGFVREGVVRAVELGTIEPGMLVSVAGLVLVRQRPGSASGVVFVTLEDETGIANLVVWPDTFERFRAELMGATLMLCRGRLQREGPVIHVVAERLTDLSPRLARLNEPAPQRLRPSGPELAVRSHDFR